ncbi:ABC transporter ATP-binding protein [Collinsella ihumii]|uniref:Fatty acid ABC transporter ATP-binding/permease protein n=1 Tax=Collinsella ihumii TaxID=1720204 RepID=A0AAW7K0L1_9ACTN|nr:ABC transporter ATP-binding protein [Collinsella ihumii]MDN0068767.1 ABC transporter ATP-binding protein [Collinsella ihumii]
MSIKEKYALTDEGVRNVKLGAAWTAAANIAVFAGVGIIYMLMDAFMAHLTDGAALPDALPYLAGLAVFIIALFVAEYYAYYYQYGVIYKESGRQRINLAERLRKLPLSFFGRRDLADLTETLMTDVKTTEHAYSHVLPELYGAYITLGVAAVGLFAFDWRLALASLWSCPVGLAVLFGARSALQPMMHATRMRGLAISEDIQEALECVREVRATNQEERYLEHIRRDVDEAERQAFKSEIACGVCVNGGQIILRLGFATTVLAGAAFIMDGTCTFMTLFAFLVVVSRIYAPFDQCLMLIAELFSARTASARMRSFYEEPLATGDGAFEPVGHDVVFDDVSFSYGGAEQVLSHVSFTAREGEVTALVGPSGSGKSTCARLAARFWDASDGRVSVGGVDVSAVDHESLLRDFSVVFQDVLLFDDTVMGNIRLGRRDATDEEVLAAARAANCDDFVSRMPQGYDTMIGENGSKLSGGERQRISIARALLKDAPVVLLDEATASLDVENETAVQTALSRLLADRTVIVIAHRMRTVLSANKIVVLDEGRVVEQGSPDELLAADGLFARMVRLQRESADWML